MGLPVREHIFLTGFMAVGKTTLGRLVAEQLAMPFLDLDEEIECRYRRSIPDLFTEGEPAFRAKEHAVLTEVLDRLPQPTLIALGGGTFIQPSNAKLLPADRVIALQLPFSVVLERIHSTERPLATSIESLQQLYTERSALYRTAGHILDMNGTETAAQLAERLSILVKSL